MTLIKSLLLGSAAGLVAVASAQAADLPTHKGPVAAEYVRICSITVAGAPVVGFVLPGSDTCFKISGYITGQIEGGNVEDGNSVTYAHQKSDTVTSYGFGIGRVITAPVLNADVNADAVVHPIVISRVITHGTVTPGAVVINRATTQAITNSDGSNSFGFTTRFNLTFDAVSNTAYGPLVAHGEYQFNHGSGFDVAEAAGSDGGLNRAYVTWAGLTAGKIDSFFSFTGGGLGWANFFSPDRKGFNQPDVLAYTASFGGGFSATISAESAYADADGINDCSSPAVAPANGMAGCARDWSGGSNTGFLGSATYNGERFPDLVGSLDVKQAWGAAHLSGVAHNVVATAADGSGNTIDKWGYAVDAGVSFNIPNMAGSMIGLTGAWSQNATWYSGLPDGMWGENGAVNGNGQAMAIGDAFYNGTTRGGTDLGWATPTAWSVTGWAAFQINPQVNLGLEGSYGQVNWSGEAPTRVFRNGFQIGSPLFNSDSFIIGGVAHYDPVKNLDFEFELLYQDTRSTQPTGYIAGNGTSTTSSWQGDANGFAARFEVTRSF